MSPAPTLSVSRTRPQVRRVTGGLRGPGAGAVALVRAQPAGVALDDEALGLGHHPVAVTREAVLDAARGAADDAPAITARVEGRREVALRHLGQLVEPGAQARPLDVGLQAVPLQLALPAGGLLLHGDGDLARHARRHAAHVGRAADEEQVRRPETVRRGLTHPQAHHVGARQGRRDPLGHRHGDVVRHPEHALVHHCHVHARHPPALVRDDVPLLPASTRPRGTHRAEGPPPPGSDLPPGAVTGTSVA